MNKLLNPIVTLGKCGAFTLASVCIPPLPFVCFMFVAQLYVLVVAVVTVLVTLMMAVNTVPQVSCGVCL